jgi:hypothetical protein
MLFIPKNRSSWKGQARIFHLSQDEINEAWNVYRITAQCVQSLKKSSLNILFIMAGLSGIIN